MRVLVTGATGFVGSHLMDTLARSYPQAVIVGRGRGLDLVNPAAVDALVSQLKPTHVIHLAGQASVPRSFQAPLETYQLNLMGTAHLLEAVLSHARDARVLCIGSADPYGASFNVGVAVTEDTALQPLNPYAGSKAAAEMVALDYASRGLNLLRLRPFNHTGPGQSDAFVVSAFAKQIAEIQLGLKPPVVEVGNLEAQRDFSDVRDMVAAYAHLLTLDTSLPAGAAINLGAGEARTIRSVLDNLIALSSRDIDVVQDPARMRPNDIPLVLADVSRARKLGWENQIPWQVTLKDMLDFWRAQLSA